MLSNNQIKQLRALHRRKYRQKYNKFMVEGEKIALEVLRHSSWPVSQIYATESWIKTHKEALYAHFKKTLTLTEKELKQLSGLSTPSPVLIVSEIPKPNGLNKDLIKDNLVLYLDQIQDPGNLGTILRIADWFGLPYVCLSPGCVDEYNPKVLQASMGAFLRVKTVHYTLPDLLQQAGDLPVFGAAMRGENVFAMKKPTNGIVVIGNEGQGISTELNPFIRQWIHIPSGNSNGAESLNAAVATGIICATLLADRLT